MKTCQVPPACQLHASLMLQRPVAIPCFHLQIRLASLLLCEVLFARSKKFRQLLVEQFPTFVEATVAAGKGLPGPQEFAEQLRALSLTILPTWASAYGHLYPQLGIAATCVPTPQFRTCLQPQLSPLPTGEVPSPIRTALLTVYSIIGT